MNPPSPQPNICIVTPYYREDRAILERCLDSVRRQRFPVDHMLVADGFPQDWLDAAPVRHIRLDRAHGDYGNAARGIGALLAIAEKYQAIAFLDADNWYADNHFETCFAAARANPRAPYVIARREFVRLDESVMAIPGGEDAPAGDHVDTNCYLFLPGAFSLLHYWATIPKEFAAVGDRMFRLIMKARLPEPALSPEPTVKYTCLFESFYRYLGETPPPGAKPGVGWGQGIEWLRRLSVAELAQVDQLSGLSLSCLVRAAA